MKEVYRVFNSEVLYSRDEITITDQSDIKRFKQFSFLNERKRVRLCAHPSQDDLLHEMLIVHERSTYVRPHKHPGKSESIHIIEGLVDVVVFDDDGRIENVISMGDYASDKIFYFRMNTHVYHTLIIRSDVLVFHETTNGPFNRSDTIFSPWAPREDEVSSVNAFMSDMDVRVNSHLFQGSS